MVERKYTLSKGKRAVERVKGIRELVGEELRAIYKIERKKEDGKSRGGATRKGAGENGRYDPEKHL